MSICASRKLGAITHLLVDSRPVTKHDVSTNKTRKERVRGPLLASVRLALDEQQRLVQGDERREIDRVGLGRLVNGRCPRLETTEERY